MTQCKTQSDSASPRWFALINDQVITAPRQKLPVSLLKTLASISADQSLIRDHGSPDDLILNDEANINLSEGNVFYSRPSCDCHPSNTCSSSPKRAFSVDDRFEISSVETLNHDAFFALFDLKKHCSIFRDFESPADKEILAGEEIRFSDGPVFYTQASSHQKDVTITINGEIYPIKQGETAVKEIKDLGSVQHGDELVQIIDGDITPLDDGASLCIKGGEVFVSHPRQGGSS